jgi:hypothetical protein
MNTFCGCSKTSPEIVIEDAYSSHTVSKLNPTEEWQVKLKDIADTLLLRYKAEHSEITDYEKIIVIGDFSLYAVGTADNYVCFSGSIRIFRYNSQALCWETNRYSADFESSKNLGRSDFIKVGTHISDITFNIPMNAWCLLGTYGEGVSTYWDYTCRDFSAEDILELETLPNLWSSWDAVSDKDWYYKQSGKSYWTYNLTGVIIK